MTRIISPTVCATMFRQKLPHRWPRRKHRWDTDSFSSAVPYHGAQHIWYAARSIFCTNLFVTIHWRRYLSSCHALVAARCLKNVASHKFQAGRLAGQPLGTRWLTRASHLTPEEERFERGWGGGGEMGGRKRERREIRGSCYRSQSRRRGKKGLPCSTFSAN